MNALKVIWLLVALLIAASVGTAHAETAHFDLAASQVVLSGYWQPGNDGGRSFIGGNNGSQLDATVAGTLVVLTCFSTDLTSAVVTVDGVSTLPTFATTNAWTKLRVHLGAEGTHALTIKQACFGASFYLDTGTGTVHGPTFAVHGQTPRLGPPALGFGPQYILSDPAFVTPFIQAEGGLFERADGGYPAIYRDLSDFTNGALYFTASATGTIQGWVYGSGANLGLYVDGARIGAVAVPQTDTYQWVPLFVGDGLPHRYGVVHGSASSMSLFIWSLMTVDGTLSTVTTPARPRLIAFGDSITKDQIGGDDSSQGYAERLGVALGWAVFNRGIGGTTVHSFASGLTELTTEAGEARVSDVTSVAAGARALIVLYGTNDMSQQLEPETPSDLQASYQNMLTQIVAGFPTTCPIICVGILPRADFSPAGIRPWNAAVQGAIKAVAAPNVTYVDPTGWGLLQNNGDTADYTDVAQNTVDGIHLTSNGHGIVMRHLLPHLVWPNVPVITSGDNGVGQVGTALAFQVTTGSRAETYRAGNLPPGLTIDPAGGLISGVPTAAGTFNTKLSATNASGTAAATLQFVITLPIVTVAATVPTTTVGSGPPGQINVSIPSIQATDLAVEYTVRGSARAGTDYVGLSGTAVLKAGQVSEAIEINPRGNPGGTGKKVVKLRLAPGEGYAVGTDAPVKVKIFAGP